MSSLSELLIEVNFHENNRGTGARWSLLLRAIVTLNLPHTGILKQMIYQWNNCRMDVSIHWLIYFVLLNIRILIPHTYPIVYLKLTLKFTNKYISFSHNNGNATNASRTASKPPRIPPHIVRYPAKVINKTEMIATSLAPHKNLRIWRLNYCQ